MNNPITGLFILFALGYDDLWRCFCGLLGLVFSTLTSHAFGFESSARRSGLHGFNGLLTGLGVGLVQPDGYAAVFTSVIFGGMSALLTVGLGNAMVPQIKVPPLTLPFNLAMFVLISSALQSQHVGLRNDIISPSLLPTEDAEVESVLNDIDGEQLFWGIVRGVGQVWFASSRVSSLLILIGICFCSRISALMAIIGSVVGAFTAICLGAPLVEVYAGLWSYDAVLGTVAIGGMFYILQPRTFLFAIANAVGCTIVHGSLKSILSPFGLLPFTLAFCLSTIIFLLLSRSVSRVRAVKLDVMTTPEVNLSRFRVRPDLIAEEWNFDTMNEWQEEDIETGTHPHRLGSGMFDESSDSDDLGEMGDERGTGGIDTTASSSYQDLYNRQPKGHSSSGPGYADIPRYGDGLDDEEDVSKDAGEEAEEDERDGMYGKEPDYDIMENEVIEEERESEINAATEPSTSVNHRKGSAPQTPAWYFESEEDSEATSRRTGEAEFY